MSHFTWWGVIYHMLTVFLSFVYHADWTTDICVQIAVVAGVWYMSACECDMLVETEKEMGTAVYALGNFFVHYFPLVSAVARRPFFSQPTAPTPTALLLWLLYNALSKEHGNTPSEIYGCSAPYEMVLCVGIAAITLATFFLHKVEHVRSISAV